MENIIEIHNLLKRYGTLTAVDNINFTVRRGDLFAFLGTNGAGKSTTINMICTLLAKTSGSIKVGGYSVDENAPEIRKTLGVVFQNNVLDDLLAVGDNLATRGRFQGLRGRALERRLQELKSLLSLTDIWQRPYGKLSGGQKRKCEIARALIGSPALLILDEPTTGLDPQTRKSIWSLIRDLQQDHGMTVFLTTHYMEEAASADDVVVLEKGAICAKGTPDDLKRQYGRDTLKIRFEDMAAGFRELAELGCSPVLGVDYISTTVSGSHRALRIVNSLASFLDFELVKGSMDDVFLAVTGHKEVPQE